MGKFSDWILFPGTAAPKIREGIKNLGFALSTEIQGFISYVTPQYLSDAEKARARNNIAAQPVAAALTSISGLTTSANQTIYTTAANTYATTTLSAFGRTLIDDASASAARTTLGLGTAATAATGTSGETVPFLNGANTWGSGQSIIGNLVLLGGGEKRVGFETAGSYIFGTEDAGGTIGVFSQVNSTIVWWYRQSFNSFDVEAPNFRHMGQAVWTAANQFALGVSALSARTNIGLGNVDNTSDANKPVSTAQQTALNLKAPLASPTFTGSPRAPTQSGSDSSTLIATTAFVSAAASAAVSAQLPAAIAATIYSGTNQDEINFPIGHNVMVVGGTDPVRNGTTPVYLATATTDYTAAAQGTQLTGTYRMRGRSTTGNKMMQRTA